MKMDQTEKLILEAIDRHRDEIIEFARDIYDHDIKNSIQQKNS